MWHRDVPKDYWEVDGCPHPTDTHQQIRTDISTPIKKSAVLLLVFISLLKTTENEMTVRFGRLQGMRQGNQLSYCSWPLVAESAAQPPPSVSLSFLVLCPFHMTSVFFRFCTLEDWLLTTHEIYSLDEPASQYEGAISYGFFTIFILSCFTKAIYLL